MKSECITLLFVLSMSVGPLHATIYVDDNAPGDLSPSDPNVGDPQEDGSVQRPFDSIQEAIDTAREGDTIVVAAGQYLSRDPWAYAELKFKGKGIRLVSSSPTSLSVAERTILCGVVIFQGDEDPNCLLQGFKIQNHACGGILGNKTRAALSHCIISGNGPSGATVVKDVRGRVANCLIVDNTTFYDRGVLPVVSGCPEIVNCTIANNLSGLAIDCAAPPRIDQITIRNCIIYGNQDHEQIRVSNRMQKTITQIEYCLIEHSRATGASADPQSRFTLLDRDPDFVRPGSWQDPALGPTRGRGSTEEPKKVLVEGDYHLKSEGWRWTGGRPAHGSPWYFDTSTSPAIDAGDPLDSLGEELERVPDDPEGRWGFNHAINLGAYGGTRHASLAPTWDTPPGVGAVDLHDFWPLRPFPTTNRWAVHHPQGTARQFRVWAKAGFGSFAVSVLETSNAPDWVAQLYCVYVYVDDTLYLVPDAAALKLLPQPPGRFQAKYPQYLIEGSTIRVCYDPFAKGSPSYRSVLVTRGTLEQVLAGTRADPARFLEGPWPDVIAFLEKSVDGILGEPLAIFARGFGPLLLAGQPVEGAVIDGRMFGDIEGMPAATR